MKSKTKKHPASGWITVIDPAVDTPELDCFNTLSKFSPLPLTYHLPALHGMESLRSELKNPAGIILLGSASSVNDHLAWQLELKTWLKEKMQRRIPTLGICFGHQFIASIFGGQVDYFSSDRSKLSGLREVFLKADELWGGRPLKGKLVVSHREIVRDCPPDMEITGHSLLVQIETLRHRRLPVWTFESHPEATQGFLINNGLEAITDSDLVFGHRLVQSFVDLVASLL